MGTVALSPESSVGCKENVICWESLIDTLPGDIRSARGSFDCHDSRGRCAGNEWVVPNAPDQTRMDSLVVGVI
jgi:hypothetical protein